MFIVYESLSNIGVLDLDITTVCNAACPECLRHVFTDQQVYVNPRLTTINQHYPVDDLINQISPLTDIKNIIITGNSGDPMSHPHIGGLCEWLTDRWPDAEINIDTNGSLGSALQWQQLADLERVSVRFAVDGWEHTNAIYRKQVPWHRLVANATQWSQLTDSRGTIKTINFPWNTDERDTIRSWAHAMDFDWVLDPRWSPQLDDQTWRLDQKHKHNYQHPKPWPENTSPDILDVGADDWVQQGNATIQQWIDQGRPLQPDCVQSKGQLIYIHHTGTVWPCCFWSTVEYADRADEKLQFKQMFEQVDPTWNSLYHHEITDIIKNPMLKNLEQWWKGTSVESVCLTCVRQCGR